MQSERKEERLRLSYLVETSAKQRKSFRRKHIYYYFEKFRNCFDVELCSLKHMHIRREQDFDLSLMSTGVVSKGKRPALVFWVLVLLCSWIKI